MIPLLFFVPKQEAAVKETTVVIYGQEREWLARFADRLRNRAQPRLKVMEFSGEEAVRAYLAAHTADLAILPEEMAPEFAAVCEVLYFTEEERPGDARAMYRYRPMSRHLEQILGFCGRQPAAGDEALTDVQAVFSPVGGAGSTAAAMLLGQILAEREPTLLVNTERWSVLPEMLPREKEGSLAELLYYARVGGDPAAHLAEVEERDGNLVWICPAPDAGDLRSASQEDWTALIFALKACGQYRHIVIDVGDGPEDEVWLLELAGRIWMPAGHGGISLQRERAFCAALERAGRDDLLGRIRRFSFPETEELQGLLDYRQLLYTAWGRYLRQLLGEADP